MDYREEETKAGEKGRKFPCGCLQEILRQQLHTTQGRQSSTSSSETMGKLLQEDGLIEYLIWMRGNVENPWRVGGWTADKYVEYPKHIPTKGSWLQGGKKDSLGGKKVIKIYCKGSDLNTIHGHSTVYTDYWSEQNWNYFGRIGWKGAGFGGTRGKKGVKSAFSVVGSK